MSKAGERYVPSLKDVVPYKAEIEVQRLWKSVFSLLDVKIDIVDQLLTMNTRIDRELTVGQPVLVLARQDTVGGWTVEWAVNPDETLKFRGTSLVTPVTTANTYSAFLFVATKTTEAMLVAWISGGNLS